MATLFTGLNKLKAGLEKDVGSILLENEIGGTSAYVLAHADKGAKVPSKSGYSFGGNQMDLAGNAKARELLKDILRNSGTLKAGEGEAYYRTIEKKLLEQGNPNALTLGQQAIINKALASSYGKDKIDCAFAEDVCAKINEVDRIIRSLPEGKIKQTLLRTRALILYLVDYHNQFHISAKVLGNKNNGKMYCYLAGQKVEMVGGPLQLSQSVTVKDLQNFGFHTDYHVSKNPKDLPRRYRNIEAYIAKNNIKVV
jgi:hypothetical protein